MDNLQFERQRLYYQWALILCIVALVGYTIYFIIERYLSGVALFKENLSLYLRLSLIGYFVFLLSFIKVFRQKVFNILGFLIAVPLGWMISVISYFTVGFDGITVTGFIFLILSSAIVFNFTIVSFSFALSLILLFHFVLLSFYPEKQPEGLLNHVFLLSLSGILGLTTNYMVNMIKKSEAKVLHERELLLKEIHHRVKNNLQVISSLLNLQVGSITDRSAKAAVRDSQARVKSMSLIHQLLYENDEFAAIDFHRYLNQLMITLQDTYKKPDKDIKYKINANKVFLDIEKAIPLGLMTNELITNAYKYAFSKTHEGFINIQFGMQLKNMYTLTVSDNGIGLPEDFDFYQSESLGLKLVRLLTEQIDGTIRIERDQGTKFIISFKENMKTHSYEQN
jgi:two-component sensor histidine kinase